MKEVKVKKFGVGEYTIAENIETGKTVTLPHY